MAPAMTIDAWLDAAIADAERRGLPELKPLLEGLAQGTRSLRQADFLGSPLVEPSQPASSEAPGRDNRPR